MNQLIHHTQKQLSIKQYRKMKLRMLKEFCIKLNDEEMERINSFKREIDIDNFCISMIKKYIKTHV
jgi:hypothetical protein